MSGRRLKSRCVYCGARTYFGNAACPAHHDLPKIELVHTLYRLNPKRQSGHRDRTRP
jgi:hypothetical protein